MFNRVSTPQSDRDEDLRRASEICARETLGRDADDGEVVVVQKDCLSDERGIAGETRLPKLMADDENRMR